MEKRAKREAWAVVLVVFLFVVLLMPALLHARREARDGIRKNEAAAFKQVLEKYYNEHETYPLEFDAFPHEYHATVKDEKGSGVAGWLIRVVLENRHDDTVDFDESEGRKYWFRMVNFEDKTFYEVCGGEEQCEEWRPLIERG